MKSLEETIKGTKPTLVVFEHAGCQDAVEVKYLVEDLKTKYSGRVNFARVDASYNGQYKVDYKLEEYPTYILYKEGEELMRVSGRKTPAELEEMVVTAF